MIENGLFMRKSECFSNARKKGYIDENGQFVCYELMVSSRPCFGSGNELSEWSKALEWKLAYDEANRELFGDGFTPAKKFVPEKLSKAELLDCSRRRARRRIFDYAICNEWDAFVTLTLDAKQIDRNDYKAVIKRLNTFLSNRVQRRGLAYLGVPEYHKNGGLHFHFAVNNVRDAFSLADSGTVSIEGRKRPIKVSTADRLGIPDGDRHTVYNITDWKLGFSTAILTYGTRGALAAYLSKELNKDCQKRLAGTGAIDKIGGRWYYHSNNLKKPVVMYENVGFRELSRFSYSVHTDGGDFKVIKLNEQGELLR